ncbi:MAG: tripartite tricarboxylate transporter substrate binding protein [Betaproteobacteria bacterium]|nr:tripartite tricarboxylate transporter substrate binding protein [Betaproteobacteria bacterium]
MFSSRFRWLLAAIVSGGCLATAAMDTLAQAYPSRPIKLVVTMPPGGPTDMLARVLATKLSEKLPQPVVVENRPGGGGIIAYGVVAKSPADGYTLLVGDLANSTINPSLYKSLPYDTRKDFTPITPVATAHSFIFVSASLPARNLQEFIALAKSQPGKLSYGSGGTGQLTHIGPELFKEKSGLDIVHVPYKGAPPVLIDVVAGRVAFLMSTGLGTAKPHIDAGKVRALAITGDKRSPAMPDVPTFAEVGVQLPELKLGNWWGLLGPAGMARDIVAKLNASVVQALGAPEVVAKLTALNMIPYATTPETFAEVINTSITTWAPIVKRMNIVLD